MAHRLDAEEIRSRRREHHQMAEDRACRQRHHARAQADLRRPVPAREHIVQCHRAHRQSRRVIPRRRHRSRRDRQSFRRGAPGSGRAELQPRSGQAREIGMQAEPGRRRPGMAVDQPHPDPQRIGRQIERKLGGERERPKRQIRRSRRMFQAQPRRPSGYRDRIPAPHPAQPVDRRRKRGIGARDRVMPPGEIEPAATDPVGERHQRKRAHPARPRGQHCGGIGAA